MRSLFVVATVAGLLATGASAVTVSYNTTGSTLSCNGIAGCVQNTSTSVTLNGLTLTYNSGSGSNVVTPSIINLGNLVTTGTSTSANLTGLQLTINVNSTPPGAGGALPVSGFSGSVSTNNSGGRITFSTSSSTTTTFGTLPGVIITGAGGTFTYQVLNTGLGLEAPTVGNPIGQTSIQGAVIAGLPSNLASVSANAGTTPQTTFVNSAFTTALSLTVKDSASNPVPGVPVTFTSPASGASGVFSDGTTLIVVNTNGSGVASAPFTANGTAGGPYSVTASATGYGAASYWMTNSAATINYNTTGSTLSCNGVAGCVQNTSTSVTIGGLTMTYNSGSGSGVITPSLVNLGNLVVTGTGANVNVTGLQLTVNVNSTPPGVGGALPVGALSGLLSTSNSSVAINFSGASFSTSFGNLPSVPISGGGRTFYYQVLNTNLGLQAPTVGNPIGQTSIQGAVSTFNQLTSRPPCDLDVDGNGTFDALTDGLMVVRAMLGLTGTAVTAGAIGGSPIRATWAQIQPFLNNNCGTNFAP